jgi:polar amino acid transport system substrate-binding protein
VLGLSKPPYVIEENHSGFELELVQQILTMIGKAPEFIFIPYLLSIN